MCIRSEYIADAVAALCAADAACDRDWARDATAAIFALPSAALANPLAVAGGLIKAGLCDREEFGAVVRGVSRAARGYAHFVKRQGDLFNGMPPLPEKKPRAPKRAAAKAKPKRRKATKPRRRARKLVAKAPPAPAPEPVAIVASNVYDLAVYRARRTTDARKPCFGETS